MRWIEALAAMRLGHQVHRRSQQMRRLISDEGEVPPVYECGMEPCVLVAAWTDDDKPVRVFSGAHSQTMFVPGDDDRAAEDWDIAP